MTGEGGVKELQFSCSKTSTTFHLCLCGVFVLKCLSSSRAISFNLLLALLSPRESRPPEFRFPSSRTRSPLSHASECVKRISRGLRDPHWFTAMMMPYGVITEREGNAWNVRRCLGIFRHPRSATLKINIYEEGGSLSLKHKSWG